jgi:hypothetical protein
LKGNGLCDPNNVGYVADLNSDCHVDTKDLEEFASQWLECTRPEDVNCTQL